MTSVRRKVEKSRFRFMNNQIMLLSQIKVNSLEVFVHTNSNSVRDHIHRNWHNLQIKVAVHERYNRVNVLHNSPWELKLDSPWYLTWEHKNTMRDAIAKSSKKTVFLVLEDDTLFTESNLRYFMENKDKLAKLGLIPSYLQVEFSEEGHHFIPVSFLDDKKVSYASLPKVSVDDQVFVQMPNPYSGVIILDFDQAHEYSQSKAFSEIESRELTWWDIGARAAMGLQFVNVPAGFKSRNVLPLNSSHTGISTCSWVLHQPNIYVLKRSFAEELTPSSMFK